MASSVASSLSSSATSVTGIGGILMAVPQLAGVFGSKNQPSNAIGYQPASTSGVVISPPSIIFHYEGEQSVSLESDITDHPIEDNTYVQDQWSIKPVIVNTHGFIGELTNALPQGPIGQALQALQIAANKLTLVGGVVPQLTVSAQLAYNNAFFAYQTGQSAANAGVSAFNSIAGTGSSGEAVFNGDAINNANALANGQGFVPSISSQSKQQLYFQQFLGYWKQRTLFTVQTPWAVFTNMAIMNVRPVQSEDSAFVTDFEVRFKQLRFASTSSTSQSALNSTTAANTKNFFQTSPNVANIVNGTAGPSLSSLLAIV